MHINHADDKLFPQAWGLDDSFLGLLKDSLQKTNYVRD